jgi:glutamine amidotransferase
VRFASAGGVELKNTHPFEQHGRLMAHNGVEGTAAPRAAPRRICFARCGRHRLREVVRAYHQRDRGQWRRHRYRPNHRRPWVAATLPVHALNFVLTTETDLWALRYPDTNGLFVLNWAPDDSHNSRRLDMTGSAGNARAFRSPPGSAGRCGRQPEDG